MSIAHVNDIALYYEHTPGTGPAVVFLHGWCCDHTYFAPQLAHYAALGRATVALDLRGHGRSDKPVQRYTMQVFADDVAVLIRQLALDKPLVVGHSMGGIVAFDLAARYPDLPGAIVMLDSSVVRPEAAKGAMPAAVAALHSPDYRQVLHDMMTHGFFIPTDDAQRQATILEGMTATPQHVMVSAFEGLRDWDPEPARGRIRVPSLYVAADEPSPRCDLVQLHGLLPGLHEGRTVGSGHFCTLEVPDQINAMLDRFEHVTRGALPQAHAD